MTPGARVQAAIEILDRMATGVAAEQALTQWARQARYAGSKDRAAVRDHVYDVLRQKNSCAAKGCGVTGRALMAGLLRLQGADPDAFFTGAPYAPGPLDGAEQIVGCTDGVRDVPAWLLPKMQASLGKDFDRTEVALRRRAPVFLRVNIRLSNMAEVIEILRKDGIEVRKVARVDTALEVREGARRITGSEAYQSGAVELQDASSQAAMAALDITPGSQVLDYCAGGGGKTLALAARAEARWVAHDAHPRRLRDLPKRAERARVSVTCLDTDAVAKAGPFDTVLCDVPCSGSGTWRRTPEAKWTLTPERLTELCEIQQDILAEAVHLVAPGGQLVYATCSILAEENEQQIAAFLSRCPMWRVTLQRAWSVGEQGDGFFLCTLRELAV